MARCSICHTRLRGDDFITNCPECRQEYHEACWTELGGCASYGCGEAAPAEKPPPPGNLGSGWGDNKPCPACGRSIAASLLLCQCGAKFPSADPLTVAEYRKWLAQDRRQSSARKGLVVLFILSMLGLVAPLTGGIAGWLAWKNREELAGSGGTYLAMGYGAAGLGAGYTLVILLLLLGL